MLLKSTFSLPQASGFVAFDGGGAADTEVRRQAPKPVDVAVVPRLEPELEAAAAWPGSRTWQPSTGPLVRRVEGLVLAAICSYFVFGLAGVAGWL
ncbi:MAG: hypothetical protein ABI745_08855 [Caldimonas sp.]